MALLGTLLFPCLALTKDLANAAAAFSVHSPNVVAARAPVYPSSGQPPQLHAETRDQNHGGRGGNVAPSSAVTGAVAKETAATTTTSSTPPPPSASPEKGTTTQPRPSSPSSSRKTAPSVQQQQQQQQPSAMVKAGTGLSRPALVTALIFLSPYPLLVGTSTGGALVVWRTSDCVCVQVRSHARWYSKNSEYKYLWMQALFHEKLMCKLHNTFVNPRPILQHAEYCSCSSFGNNVLT